jgi:hypothetical protein
MRRCQILISFQGQVLTVEELGGIDPHFIIFNPDRSTGAANYKIHLTERILLRFEGETKLISILDYPDEFVIINSKGDILTDSKNTNPEFVEHFVNNLGKEGLSRKDLN